MEIKKRPEEIWQEYQKGIDYNTNLELYDTVKQNENFFVGKQWEGLNAPDLDKPVLNFIKRVVSYFISMIVTDDIAANITPQKDTEGGRMMCDILSREIDSVLESNDLTGKCRYILQDAAVDGDACAYLYYDGAVKIELVDNTRIIFGNPYISDVHKQPYIIIVIPMLVGNVKDIAKNAGIDPDAITADYQEQGETSYTNEDRATVLLKFWRERKSGTIHFSKTTQSFELTPDTDTGYGLYPVSYMSWDRIKNSYHGQAAITGLIPNQIAVNKLWAMALRHQHMMAFPKVIYDSSRIKSWSNRVGEAIAVNGNPNEAIATNFRAADMSDQLVQIVQKTIDLTRDFMGASDAALGNVKPDNTSAIIAVQKASSAPLELQRLSFYQFIESIVRIIIDIIKTDYGIKGSMAEVGGQMQQVDIDFSKIDLSQFDINVDIGSAAYWSELMQVQTADNLFAKGIIADAETYLDSVPDKYVRNKADILKRLNEMKQQQMIQQEMMMGGAPSALPQMQASAPGI